MSQLNIGLVGCGLFGEYHAKAFDSIRYAHITAVYDVDESRAAAMAQKFNIPRVCHSLEEICALPDLQAIDVVTPEHLHRDPVVAALKANKHVLVEKPIATELDDCQAMIDAASASDGFLMVGHLLRFDARYELIKRKVDSGKLGQTVSMRARRNRSLELCKLYTRCHAAMVNCTHDVDLMMWYHDKPVHKVRGYQRKIGDVAQPNLFWGVLEFEGGVIGIVECIWFLQEQAGVVADDVFQLVGTEGIANMESYPGILSFWESGGMEVADAVCLPQVQHASKGTLVEELRYFCDCILDNTKPQLGTPEHCMKVLRVIKALIQSAQRQEDVVLGAM